MKESSAEFKHKVMTKYMRQPDFYLYPTETLLQMLYRDEERKFKRVNDRVSEQFLYFTYGESNSNVLPLFQVCFEYMSTFIDMLQSYNITTHLFQDSGSRSIDYVFACILKDKNNIERCIITYKRIYKQDIELIKWYEIYENNSDTDDTITLNENER